MNYKKQKILSINNLSVSFDSFGSRIIVFDDLNLPKIYLGDWVFLIGDNGSGKSTLFNILTRENEDFKGEVIINGSSITNLSKKEISENLFLINQNPKSTTVEELTVFENLIFTIKDYKKRELNEILTEIKLDKHKNHLVKNLSGGQRQLLALQIAKIRKVKLLLLDEPFAALDPLNVKMATDIIKELWVNGTTIFFITHDMDYIDKLEIKEKRIFNLSEIK